MATDDMGTRWNQGISSHAIDLDSPSFGMLSTRRANIDTPTSRRLDNSKYNLLLLIHYDAIMPCNGTLAELSQWISGSIIDVE